MNREQRLEADGYAGIEPVLFYRSKTLGSNFSPHRVRYLDPWEGKPRVYKTCEHRYQAMKATTAKDHEYVCGYLEDPNNTPLSSKGRGREIKLREGWGEHYGDFCWYVMFEVVLGKTLQHAEVQRWLRSTGDRPIYEDSPVDDIWGWRYRDDYRGRNLLGRCWMQVRGVGRGLAL
jgi:ribA/ribD-fused uncharacterized protein